MNEKLRENHHVLGRRGKICFKVRSNYFDVTESSRYSELYETGASTRDGIILAGGLFGILLGFGVKKKRG